MKFEMHYWTKSTVKKKKSYEFNFAKEDVDEGMKKSYENPHICRQFNSPSLSTLFGLYKDEDNKLCAIMFHTYHVFSESDTQ